MSESAWQSRAELPSLFRPEFVIGAASPLWGYFAGAAAAGMAFWSMTRLVRPEGLAAAETAVETELAVAAEAAADAETVVEAAVEPALEAVAEAVGGPVGEALAGEELPVFPVGGEAAPFGAVTLEAELISDPGLAADLTPDAPAAAEEAPAPAPRAAAPRTRKPREGGEAKPN